jgi:hypothetical protein
VREIWGINSLTKRQKECYKFGRLFWYIDIGYPVSVRMRKVFVEGLYQFEGEVIKGIEINEE